ncbi:MAG: HD domain-containing protein [Lachnospiraceae bacterium]|nr:HD domain-containing protein [Lachnospiraceae bacterium]
MNRKHKTGDAAFHELLAGLAHDPRILEMKKYTQHGTTTTYDHCLKVAKKCYDLNHRLHLGADDKELVLTALLHDYFLYDWHDKSHPLHGYTHADAAADNAVRDFGIGREEEEAIRSHMWPLNISRIPTSKTGWILTIADKLCSAEETAAGRYKKHGRLHD